MLAHVMAQKLQARDEAGPPTGVMAHVRTIFRHSKKERGPQLVAHATRRAEFRGVVVGNLLTTLCLRLQLDAG